MTSSFIVNDGDHLSKIAKKLGFRSFRTIWDDPENVGLQQRRTNPNVLLPGDVVSIPDKEARDEPADTGKRHTFITLAPALKLRIVVKDHFNLPQAGEVGTLDIDGDERPVTTGGDGLVERAIAADAEGGQIDILGGAVTVRIGRLHPVDHVSGWLARLNNLGYYAGDVGNPDASEVRSAIEEFQCDFGLSVVGLRQDGTLDDATRNALLAAHGC